jgi:hypothetical protein
MGNLEDESSKQVIQQVQIPETEMKKTEKPSVDKQG